jgi:hypothetical protein
MLGEKFDPEKDVGLYSTTLYTARQYKIEYAGETISFRFAGIGMVIDDTRDTLFSSDSEYTFRDYGKLKNFDDKDTFHVRMAPGHTHITIDKSYLKRLRSSPEIDVHYVKDNITRLYALDIFVELTEPIIRLSLTNITDRKSFTFILEPQEAQYLYDMLGEQQVIAIFPIINRYSYDLLLLVDDDTKRLLNKLIYIYSNISDFLNKHNISLKDILEDIDLYVAVAAAAATAT